MHMHVQCVCTRARVCVCARVYICMLVDVIVTQMWRLHMIAYYMFILPHPKCILRL